MPASTFFCVRKQLAQIHIEIPGKTGFRGQVVDQVVRVANTASRLAWLTVTWRSLVLDALAGLVTFAWAQQHMIRVAHVFVKAVCYKHVRCHVIRSWHWPRGAVLINIIKAENIAPLDAILLSKLHKEGSTQTVPNMICLIIPEAPDILFHATACAISTAHLKVVDSMQSGPHARDSHMHACETVK